MKQSQKALWSRILRETRKNLLRQKFIAFTVIFILSIIFLVINLLFCGRFLAEISIENLEKRADFLLPLKPGYDSFTFEALKNELEQSQEINIKDEILAPRKEGDIDLPSHWHVQFGDLETIHRFFEIVKNPKYNEIFLPWDKISEADFLGLVSQVLELKDLTQKMSLGLLAGFLILMMIMLFQIFRLILFQRREEFFIAQCVGADERFITFPIAAEGAILGGISSLLGMVLTILLLTQIQLLPSGELFLRLWESVFFWEFLGSMLGGWGLVYICARKYNLRTI